MVERSSAGRRQDGIRCARIAPAVACLLAVGALAFPVQAPAVDADRSQSRQRVRDAYPLLPATERPTAAAPADAGSAPAATEMATAPSDEVERLVVASLLALIAGGVTMWLVSLRWPHARVVTAGAVASWSDAAPVRSSAPDLWLHSVAPPPIPEPPAVEPPAFEPPAAPAARSPRPSAPPEPNRAWAAEIGWHLVDDAAQFRVTARPVDRSAESVTLAASAALAWPPAGARSVQALTDAVKVLESGLVAAGWTPLPRGSAWYAKRFTWQPGARPRPTPATAGRTRHRKLYEAEYAQQVDRTQRLRDAISARLIAQSGGTDSNGTAPQ